jgi:hypothetical protein
MAITFAIVFYLGRVFSHPNAWFLRATETVSPSPGGEGRGEGGLQTKIELPFKIFRQSLSDDGQNHEADSNKKRRSFQL